ncbi:MAG: hypothetical protein V2A61_06320, partial [Calditrichota bacterium]
MDVFQIGYTDADGRCAFIINPDQAGPFQITALEQDVYPYKANITRERPAAFVRADVAAIDDGENGDGEANPGETLSLSLVAHNLGSDQTAVNVIGTVTADSPFLQVEDNEISFGNIQAGQEAEGNAPVIVRVHRATPDGEPLHLNVHLTAEDVSWDCAIPIDPIGFDVEAASVANNGVIPAGMSELRVELVNQGRRPIPPFTARLLSSGWEMNVVEAAAQYQELAPNQRRNPRDQGFRVSGNELAVPGSRISARMVIEVGGAVVDTARFTAQVGTPRDGAPIGPDAYGYICFDNTDENFTQAPDYAWVEVNPRDNNVDIEGTQVRIDHGDNSNGWAVVRLPFAFQYYGREFDRITVCTNGFLSVGEDANFVPNFQNWPMDGGGFGGGYGMIAPLWDDLTLAGQNAGIWVAYDEEWARFIVEWFNVRHSNGGNVDMRFQVQLYNPEVWANATGDGNIGFMYQTVANQSGNVPNFASVGIGNPDNSTGIAYSAGNQYPVGAAPLANRRAILFTTAPRNITGRLFGRVADAANGQPLVGATVYTGYGQAALTNDNGDWDIPEALALPFTITAYLQGYNDSTLVDTLEEHGEIEINFALLHPEFVPSAEQLELSLNPDQEAPLDLSLLNSGNGPLTWSVDRQLRGEANAAPWELRRSYPISEITGDPRIAGVAFLNNHFYVTGHAAGDHLIYVLDREGNITDTLNQLGQSQYGMQDLAWDGEWLWGSGERRIFGFTPDGQQQVVFDGLFNPMTNVAWDPDRGILWSSGSTTDIVGYTREGQQVARLNRRGLRQYGLAYWPDDPDGYPLYIFHSPTGNMMVVTKMNPANNDTLPVRVLEGVGRATAVEITNELDVYSWVFVAVANNDANDRIDIWQLDARKDWMQIAPTQGRLASGDRQPFDFSLNSTGLPPVLFVGDLVFTHNARGGETRIAITLNVEPGPGQPGQRVLNFNAGWNMVSLNIDPDIQQVPELFAPLVENEQLTIVKDGEGRFFAPEREFNNIPSWDFHAGYQVFVHQPCSLEVPGLIPANNEPIPLHENWNLIAYLPRDICYVQAALSGLGEHLQAAKDGFGCFYLPEFDFSNMSPLRPGLGYQIKVDQAVDLVYAQEQRAAAVCADLTRSYPNHFAQPQPGFDNMSLLLLGDRDQSGCELAAFNMKGVLVGAGVFDDQGRCGLALWGDDPATQTIEGLVPGERPVFSLW